MSGSWREIVEITLRSLNYALVATALAMAAGMPIGLFLARRRHWLARAAAAIFGAAAALPTVVIGLFCFWLIARNGPLGELRWLYTSWGVIFGEFFLGWPIVVTHLYTALRQTNPALHETLATFGASRRQTAWAFLREFAMPLSGAFILSFGRIVGEVGIAMMLGGNIRHATRTMTTAIALESAKGEWTQSIRLGMTLLIIAIIINILVIFSQKNEA